MLRVGPFAEDEALLWKRCHGDCFPSAASRSLITLSTEDSDFVDQITLIIMSTYWSISRKPNQYFNVEFQPTRLGG